MRTPFILILTVALTMLATTAAFATEGQEMTEEEMMQAWMEAAAPGPQHEALAQLAGNWTSTTTSYEGPEPAVVSTGNTVKTMILGGRYLMEDTQGESMGMPFHGVGLTGYNNTTGQYEWVWYDNMSTAILFGTGGMEGNTLTCHLDYADPISKKQMKAKLTVTIESPDRHVFSWYNLADGKEVKAMGVEYVRK